MALLPTNALPQAEAADVLLREMLPPYLLHVIDFSFLRSHYLYDEFVYRLTLQVIRETGLESATQDGGSAEAIAARSGLAVDQAVVPLDWMLRLLATLSTTTDFSVGCYCANEARCHRSILRSLLAEQGAVLT